MEKTKIKKEKRAKNKALKRKCVYTMIDEKVVPIFYSKTLCNPIFSKWHIYPSKP